MIFWTSFLVFLASIMIYLLFPARTDQINLDTYREDPLIISFVNQHQAAKDYMNQMVLWKTSGEGSAIHLLNNTDLEKFIPKAMQGMYNDIGTPDSEGNNNEFASGVICLDNTNALVECDSTNNSYIITYGYVPSWWDANNMRRQGFYQHTTEEDGETSTQLIVDTVWLKPMLRRTHGSTACGVLKDLGKSESVYVIDNGQVYKGFQESSQAGQKMIPLAVGKKLDKTLLPNDSVPILICMTPYQNPYVQTPVFHWDVSHNSETNSTGGHTGGIGVPLIGSFGAVSDKIQCGSTESCTLNNYTITGTVTGCENSTETLLTLNTTDNVTVNVSCSETCVLTIGETTWSGIPKGKPFSFTYSANSEKQKLNVTYTVYTSEKKCINSSEDECNGVGEYYLHTTGGLNPLTWITSNTGGPALSEAYFSADSLANVLIYNRELSNKEVLQNNKANQKRFGI